MQSNTACGFNTAVSTVNIPKATRSCSWTYKIKKLIVSPNERLNNITLERTIEYNTTQPQNSTAKESNATSEIESTLKEGPKSTLPAHVLTFYCPVTCPVAKIKRGGHFCALTGMWMECGFSSLQPYTGRLTLHSHTTKLGLRSTSSNAINYQHATDTTNGGCIFNVV